MSEQDWKRVAVALRAYIADEVLVSGEVVAIAAYDLLRNGRLGGARHILDGLERSWAGRPTITNQPATSFTLTTDDGHRIPIAVCQCGVLMVAHPDAYNHITDCDHTTWQLVNP